MHHYDSLSRTPEELLRALEKEGAVLALDHVRFEIVPTATGVMLQLRGIDPSLPIAIPIDALRVFLPHRPSFVPPPEEAVRFAIADHIVPRVAS